MFYLYDHPSIRYTGRIARFGDAMVTTAPGTSFLIAFRGDEIRLQFDISGNIPTMPRLYLQLDGGARTEAPLAQHLHICASHGEHTLEVLVKSSMEKPERWYPPLRCHIAFQGYEAESAGVLAPDLRKTVEFVGDSITEGTLLDAQLQCCHEEHQENLPYQNDVTHSWDWLVEKHFGLRGLHMGYGAVGVTHGGNGRVPKAADAYPWCFDGVAVPYESPDYIIINHGANDRRHPEEEYIREYENLLDVIRGINPTSKLICISAFCGAHHEALGALIAGYNREKGADITFIDSTGWVPPEPLHPLRDGHKTIAEHLYEELKDILG